MRYGDHHEYSLEARSDCDTHVNVELWMLDDAGWEVQKIPRFQSILVLARDLGNNVVVCRGHWVAGQPVGYMEEYSGPNERWVREGCDGSPVTAIKDCAICAPIWTGALQAISGGVNNTATEQRRTRRLSKSYSCGAISTLCSRNNTREGHTSGSRWV